MDLIPPRALPPGGLASGCRGLEALNPYAFSTATTPKGRAYFLRLKYRFCCRCCLRFGNVLVVVVIVVGVVNYVAFVYSF